jgi:hypothetical protein
LASLANSPTTGAAFVAVHFPFSFKNASGVRTTPGEKTSLPLSQKAVSPSSFGARRIWICIEPGGAANLWITAVDISALKKPGLGLHGHSYAANDGHLRPCLPKAET